MTKARRRRIEKFDEADLTSLRRELMKAGLDSWQAADLISSFLTARGYGVSTQDARDTAHAMEIIGCPSNASRRSSKNSPCHVHPQLRMHMPSS